MDLTFRQPVEADLDTLLELMVALYAEDGASPLAVEPARAALRELMGDPERGRVWLIEVDGTPAGYLVVT